MEWTSRCVSLPGIGEEKVKKKVGMQFLVLKCGGDWEAIFVVLMFFWRRFWRFLYEENTVFYAVLVSCAGLAVLRKNAKCIVNNGVLGDPVSCRKRCK